MVLEKRENASANKNIRRNIYRDKMSLSLSDKCHGVGMYNRELRDDTEQINREHNVLKINYPHLTLDDHYMALFQICYLWLVLFATFSEFYLNLWIVKAI